MCLYNLLNKKNRYGYSIVTETIKKMKQGKAGGPSGVIVEIIKPGGRDCYCDIRACKSIHI